MKHWKLLKGLVALVAILVISYTQMSSTIALTAAIKDAECSNRSSTIALTADIKDAECSTKKANQQVLKDLPFKNTEDFDLATKGFIAKLSDPVLIPPDGEPEKIGKIWNLDQYQFLLENERVPSKPKKLPAAPNTVNPSLWRNAQLNMQHGLYKVKPGIYQIRGYDLAEITLVEGKNGWIVIDPLTSNETATAAMDLVDRNMENMELQKHSGQTDPLPVSAIIYTHSHIDHYAGVQGLFDRDAKPIQPSEIPIYAPEGFLEEAVSENVLAGNVMSRRASYMYGNLIDKKETGQVDGGLGKTTSAGTVSLFAPTRIISTDAIYDAETGEEILDTGDAETGKDISDKDEKKKFPKTTIDGVKIQFQNVPGSEAPAEMLFYFPDFQALCVSEDATHTMHNLYTLRGAKVRDAIGWAKYLNEAINEFGDNIDVVFASHHWPTWDKDETPDNNEAVEYLKKQRDLYKYIHDQTLRFANQGYTMLEIAEMLELPKSLSEEWYNRGYYGTLNHNVKAVYQRYLGWFDGNPAHLYSLPPEDAGAKYVEYIGGARAAIDKAKEDFTNGEYRWVAQVMSDVVFGTCKGNLPPYKDKRYDEDKQNCINATRLEADALEQLGYQAESAPWRNFFLTGAQELRNGVPKDKAHDSEISNTIDAMTSDLLFDYMAIRLDGVKAEHLKKYTFRIKFPHIDEQYLLSVENSVLNYTKEDYNQEYDRNYRASTKPDTTIEIERNDFNEIIRTEKFEDLINYVPPEDAEKFREFVNLLDKNIPFWFNIVLPHLS